VPIRIRIEPESNDGAYLGTIIDHVGPEANYVERHYYLVDSDKGFFIFNAGIDFQFYWNQVRGIRIPCEGGRSKW
jgi:hypothetical protein